MNLRITVEGIAYNVEVEFLAEGAELSLAELEADPCAGLTLPPPPLDLRPEDRVCRSPIPGLVIAVPISLGQAVRKDETIAVIEAMKMQISIGAPLEGVIEQISAKPGDSVRAGQILCQLSC